MRLSASERTHLLRRASVLARWECVGEFEYLGGNGQLCVPPRGGADIGKTHVHGFTAGSVQASIQCPASRGGLSRGQNHLLGASDRSGKLEGLYPCRRDLSFSDTSLFSCALKRRAWSCPGSLQLCPPQWEWPLPAPLLSLLSRHTQTLRQTALSSSRLRFRLFLPLVGPESSLPRWFLLLVQVLHIIMVETQVPESDELASLLSARSSL